MSNLEYTLPGGELVSEEQLLELVRARLDVSGRELLNPVPVAPPVGYRRQPSLAEQIRAMVRSERLAAEAEAAGMETFEEADDFDVGDDFDPTSPYEGDFDPIPEADLRALRGEPEPEATPSAPPAKPAAGDQPAPATEPAKPA